MNISSKETTAPEHSNNHQRQPISNFKKKNTNQNSRGGSLSRRTESCTSSTNNTDGGRSSSYSHYFSNDSIVSTEQNKKNIRKFLVSTLHKNVKDRKILLETEEKLSNFINCDDRTLKFDPMTSYDRMLIHRTASFFNLDHNVDQSGKCVVITKNEKSRCPDESFNSMIKSDHFSDTRSRYRSRRGTSNPSFYYSGNVTDYSYQNSISSPVDFDYNNQTTTQQYDNRTVYNGCGYKGRQSGQGFYHDSGMSDLTNETISPRYESPLECYGVPQSPLPIASNYNVGIQPSTDNNQITEEVGKISDELSQRIEISSETNEGTIISPTPPPQNIPQYYYHPQQPYNRNFFPPYTFDPSIQYQQPPWNPYQQQFVSQQYIPGRVIYYQHFYPPPQPQENCIYPIVPSSSPGIVYPQHIGPYNSYYSQQTVFENEEQIEEPPSTSGTYNEDNTIQPQDYSTSPKEEDTNKTET
uniref:R3H domain-containing protein n=1 Tax=Strongyloides stercoralis TaxID=6248 RepID=A0A0K0DWD6_STRER